MWRRAGDRRGRGRSKRGRYVERLRQPGDCRIDGDGFCERLGPGNAVSRDGRNRGGAARTAHSRCRCLRPSPEPRRLYDVERSGIDHRRGPVAAAAAATFTPWAVLSGCTGGRYAIAGAIDSGLDTAQVTVWHWRTDDTGTSRTRLTGGYSARSIVTGSTRTARITAGSEASNAAANIVRDGRASIARSVAFTW
jgi:hypothetical protein